MILHKKKAHRKKYRKALFKCISSIKLVFHWYNLKYASGNTWSWFILHVFEEIKCQATERLQERLKKKKKS